MVNILSIDEYVNEKLNIQPMSKERLHSIGTKKETPKEVEEEEPETTDLVADFNEMKNDLMGLTISDAKKLLGYWWTLNNQNVSASGGTYTFERSGKGIIEIQTDSKNIIIDVSGSFITSNRYRGWKS